MTATIRTLEQAIKNQEGRVAEHTRARNTAQSQLDRANDTLSASQADLDKLKADLADFKRQEAASKPKTAA